ncbi:transposase [Sinorhizobium alkalisoli]|nr:transposase [Sinorhizobium alkalisoli]MCG5481668.1 transposase [Sinorhizobium alkalisoli]
MAHNGLISLWKQTFPSSFASSRTSPWCSLTAAHTDVETLFSHRLWRNRETMSGLRFEGMKPPSAQRFALAAKTIKTGERLVLATNRDPRRADGLYRRRWQIECLFAETKTRGLNIEDTRRRQPNKVCLLLAIVGSPLPAPNGWPARSKAAPASKGQHMATAENPPSAPDSTTCANASTIDRRSLTVYFLGHALGWTLYGARRHLRIEA